MLAHELRNPLAPISAAAELLDNFSLDEKRIKSTSQIIIRQVKHLAALVDDLLDVSRVTRGLVRLNRLPLDLHSVIYDAVEQVRSSVAGRGHRLRLDLGAEAAQVLGDQKRLVQIVANLLDNAAKYTPDGGEIDIVLKIEDEFLEISVTDSGIGIPAGLQPRVFDLFTQAERTSDRVQGGLGIGLALVKSLTEMHDGQISCFSLGHGHGSQFTLTLPRHLLAENPSIKSGNSIIQTSMAGKPLRILVVDDNVDAATVLALYLEASGHNVLVEYSSTAALERAVLEQPDVCILDIGLPEMDGNELARRLKAEEKTSRALLIALTGYSQEQDRIKAKMAGFDQFFVKPFDPILLAGLLTQHHE
jgi:CheY-like chemotaxis protein